MLRFLRNNRGFALLEILLAILLGITTGPLWGGLDQGLEGILSASRRTVATELASADLEKQLSLWGGAYEVKIPPKEVISPANYPGFIIVRDIVVEERSLNGERRPNLLKINVTVKWQEHDKEEQVRLASFLSERQGKYTAQSY